MDYGLTEALSLISEVLHDWMWDLSGTPRARLSAKPTSLIVSHLNSFFAPAVRRPGTGTRRMSDLWRENSKLGGPSNCIRGVTFLSETNTHFVLG